MTGLLEREIELPRRGTTFVREISGPPSAPVLVLLHGLAATALLNWGPSLAPLGRAFRVLAIDHRGHGRGIVTRRRFRLEDCADDAAALADALGVERFIPVGYSMGGPIAQLVWRRHPQRIAGLVLCATAGRFAGARQQLAASALAPLLVLAARSDLGARWKQAAQRALLDGIEHPEMRRRIEEETEGTDPAKVLEAGAALARFDSGSWIGKVDVPTAVVVTTRDRHVPAVRQLELAAAIPGATKIEVEADHYACVARPDLFVPALFHACRGVAMATPVRVIA